MIENGSKVLYTGDLNLKGGFITEPADTPQCDVLIMEATFGRPSYVFPKKAEVAKHMVDWAKNCHSKGKTPVFLGYALGKAQELTKALSRYLKVYVDGGAYQFNRQAEKLGLSLGRYLPAEAFSSQEDCVIVAPPNRSKEYGGEGYSVAFVSGWASKARFFPKYGCHTSFPLSDHSDFYDLINFVEKTSPQVVYTVHGFSEEFSSHLRDRGFYSEPLSKAQKRLEDF
jgi:Cft2 family RNA processing exonuclease